MYLVAHQDQCQMVTGGAVIHSVAVPIELPDDRVPKQTITVRIERGAGFRYCTCEPILAHLSPSNGSDAGNYLIPKSL